MKPLPNIFAYSTESFYALGVAATDKKAIAELFRLKKREVGKPIALIAANLKQVEKFFVLSPEEKVLAKKYWPGSLTILLRAKSSIAVSALLGKSKYTDFKKRSYSLLAKRVSFGKEGRIGIRVPKHAQARTLARAVKAPITATSANISGQPPTKSARKVKRDFPGILVMSGRCGKQTRPSTIISLDKTKINIIRHGAVNV